MSLHLTFCSTFDEPPSCARPKVSYIYIKIHQKSAVSDSFFALKNVHACKLFAYSVSNKYYSSFLDVLHQRIEPTWLKALLRQI
jgi:hypothetical protein